MPINTVKLFDTNPGSVFDLSSAKALDIFNRSVAEKAKQLQEQARTQEQESVVMDDWFQPKPVEPLSIFPGTTPSPDTEQSPDDRYSLPTQPISDTSGEEKIKLSNYGYDSDTSPDYNSNVLRIGHSNNPLEDNVSAALSRSLAKRLGIGRGQMFEAVTSTGEVIRRRYDDTLPSTYRGKALPETVDLFNTKGSNNFGGTIIRIKPLTD